MELHQAEVIMEARSMGEVNRKLASGEGWKLLAVSTSGKDGNLSPSYILGRFNTGEPPDTGIGAPILSE